MSALCSGRSYCLSRLCVKKTFPRRWSGIKHQCFINKTHERPIENYIPTFFIIALFCSLTCVLFLFSLEDISSRNSSLGQQDNFAFVNLSSYSSWVVLPLPFFHVQPPISDFPLLSILTFLAIFN